MLKPPYKCLRMQLQYGYGSVSMVAKKVTQLSVFIVNRWSYWLNGDNFKSHCFNKTRFKEATNKVTTTQIRAAMYGWKFDIICIWFFTLNWGDVWSSVLPGHCSYRKNFFKSGPLWSKLSIVADPTLGVIPLIWKKVIKRYFVSKYAQNIITSAIQHEEVPRETIHHIFEQHKKK